MCGIVGVIQSGDGTLKTAVEALQRLEYRGYDSFGVSVLDEHGIRTKKAVGSVTAHTRSGFFKDVKDGASVIAHTRWATHGGVSEENAHPHVSFDGEFSVVHNGVIENYRELQTRLAKAGIELKSETDTETIAHLLALHYQKTGSVMKAFEKTLADLKGEYAVVFTTVHDPERLYAARHKSPLGIGHTGEMTIVASDQRAVGPLSSHITFLEDGDVVVLSSGKAEMYARGGKGDSLQKVTRKKTPIVGDNDDGLGGYPHYMIKEIHEAPIAAERVFAIDDKKITAIARDMLKKDIVITGAGSSFYAAQMGQYYFAELAKTYVRVHPSDEIMSLVTFDRKSHLVAMSQSGETFDTLEVMRAALAKKSTVTAITNVLGSSSDRLATFPLFQGSGLEVCVLSTKSLVSQTLLLYRIAKKLAELKGHLSPAEAKKLTKDEKDFPDILRAFFKASEKKIKETAGWNRNVDNWFFIGRGIHYPLAMENALKFKEVSYLHAEGMPAGFFKHGTISLIDESFYTIAFLPAKSGSELFRLTASNIAEIHARGGHVIGIGHDKDVSDEIGGLYDYIALPNLNPHLNPIFQLITGQLLAYYCAASLGRNIDKPRALAKSVTVR